jgi:hypothetical protein
MLHRGVKGTDDYVKQNGRSKLLSWHFYGKTEKNHKKHVRMTGLLAKS